MGVFFVSIATKGEVYCFPPKIKGGVGVLTHTHIYVVIWSLLYGVGLGLFSYRVGLYCMAQYGIMKLDH